MTPNDRTLKANQIVYYLTKGGMNYATIAQRCEASCIYVKYLARKHGFAKPERDRKAKISATIRDLKYPVSIEKDPSEYPLAVGMSFRDDEFLGMLRVHGFEPGTVIVDAKSKRYVIINGRSRMDIVPAH